MKKILLTFVLLVGVVFGLFAQNLTYQAVIRDNNQQLVTNTAVKATVTIMFETGNPYTETVNATTNIHGLLTFEFGDASLIGRDFEGATITTTVKSADESVVYVNNLERPVSAVPYALSVNGQSIQNYLTEHHYVDKTELDSRHYLTSDSTVITTMQGNITSNATNITSLQSGLSAAISKEKTDSTTLAGRIDALEGADMDCNKVKDCIKDTLSKYTVTDVLNGLLQQLEARLTGKIDSLAHVVDSLAKLVPGTAFTCGTDSVKDVDNNWYHTVKIGNQCWMAQNLRTSTNAAGAGNIYTPTASEVPGYDVNTYGRLYDWDAVMQGGLSSTAAPSGVQGICPAGWHVPSDAEWDTLTKYVYNSANPDYKCSGCESSVWEQSTKCIANALSSSTGWQSPSVCGSGHNSTTLNATGFAAVPAGNCDGGGFRDFGNNAYFWAATQDDDNRAWFRYLRYYASDVSSNRVNKVYGFSVRCLRDAGVGGGTTPSAPATMSCEDVMECMGDTLGKLNTKIEDLNTTVTAQGQTITTQGQTITAQGQTITAQGQTIDSLAHVVDSLAKLVPGGDTTAFTCGTSKVKDADCNEYNTVQIGNQCWMAQNLRTKIGGDGDKGYPTGAGNDTVTYGRLYTWSAMMKGAPSTNYPAGTTAADTIVQGICPDGWHVPSDAEWDTLTYYVYNSANPDYKCSGCSSLGWEKSTKCIANALSSSTGWSSSTSEGCNAGNMGDKANATGFSAVPAGECFYGIFYYFGESAYFWSATQNDDDDTDARFRRLDSDNSAMRSRNFTKNYGLSVRCLRDAGVGGGTTPSAPATMSCEDVMECMGDTLGKLNTKIEDLNTTVTAQGQTIDSLAHVVDSLAKLVPGGDTTAFTCGTSKVKDVDDNEYNTVKIGDQCWMKENLRTKIGGDGDKGYPTEAGNDTVTYGRLYTWTAMMKGAPSTNYPAGTTEADTIVRGICPAGWHVPSNAEWTQLTSYVRLRPEYVCEGCSGTDDEWYTYCIANALSSSTGWSSSTSEGCNAGNMGDKANATGFAAVPAGRCFDGDFSDFGYNAYFWSATLYFDGVAWCRYLLSYDSGVTSSHGHKDNGFSVRCLRD